MVKFKGWTYFGDAYKSIGDELLDCIDFRHNANSIEDPFIKFKNTEAEEKHKKLSAISEECEKEVIVRCKEKGIHFDGTYHQNGDYGCPVFETEFGDLKWDCTFRYWGQVMADAGFAESYIDYAWDDYGEKLLPIDVEDDEFLLFKGGFEG